MLKTIAAAALSFGLLFTAPALSNEITDSFAPAEVSASQGSSAQWASLPSTRRHKRRYERAPGVQAGGSVQAMATEIAQAEGVNPALVRAVLHVESTGNCRASSHAGALGAMQVKRATAASVGVHGNLHDCRTGITAGVRYLRQALAKNHGNVCAAASSYNTGLGVTGRCSGYGRKVLAHMGRVRLADAE